MPPSAASHAVDIPHLQGPLWHQDIAPAHQRAHKQLWSGDHEVMGADGLH